MGIKDPVAGHLFSRLEDLASLWRRACHLPTSAFQLQTAAMSMLSRSLLRASVCARNSVLLSQRAAVLTTGAAKSGNAWVDGIDIFENEKNPERDHVNFPRRKIAELPSPVRHWWIPEEYFQFFHAKTGVTGPYMFAISLGTFMSSKEIFVYEHDFYCGLAFWAAMITLVNVAGPGITKSLDAEIDANKAELDSI